MFSVGGAGVLNIAPTTENTRDPPFISVTGGAATNPDYTPLLYKNSTGS